MTGIAVFAHGSSIESANDGVRAFTSELARRGGFGLIETSFLELGKPDLPEAVERLIEAGADRILVLPYFLTLGVHLQRDLPRIVQELSVIHKGVEICVAEPMDGHPALLRVLLDRAEDILSGGSSSESQAS
jgi:sirohydrochlorin ferrochelatase